MKEININQRFGVEIEMTGLTRNKAANVVAKVLNGKVLENNLVKAPDDRIWKITDDTSIHSSGSLECRVELVTPICNYPDIETIQKIIRALKKSGAEVNESCGIHIHIDATGHCARSIKNLVNIMASKENILIKALNVNANRLTSFCKKTDETFLKELNSKKVENLIDIKNMWYAGFFGDTSRHYHPSRYRTLNLHSIWDKGTIEFRLFNSTLHAGEVKSYIQLCLAMSSQALNQSRAKYKETKSDNEKYTFRTWLLAIELIGDEYKTARFHLLKNLEGNIAWRQTA